MGRVRRQALEHWLLALAVRRRDKKVEQHSCRRLKKKVFLGLGVALVLK